MTLLYLIQSIPRIEHLANAAFKYYTRRKRSLSKEKDIAKDCTVIQPPGRADRYCYFHSPPAIQAENS